MGPGFSDTEAFAPLMHFCYSAANPSTYTELTQCAKESIVKQPDVE